MKKEKTDEITLKPCPFCGGRAYITETFQKMHINCEHTSECICRTGTWLSSNLPLETQIRRWNERI